MTHQPMRKKYQNIDDTALFHTRVILTYHNHMHSYYTITTRSADIQLYEHSDEPRFEVLNTSVEVNFPGSTQHQLPSV